MRKSTELLNKVDEVLINCLDSGTMPAESAVGLLEDAALILVTAPEMATLESQKIDLIEDLLLLPRNPAHVEMLSRGLDRLI